MRNAEREEMVQSEIVVLRVLAASFVETADRIMVELGMSLGLISEKNQAAILMDLYDGVIELAGRLNRWDEALVLTREAAVGGVDTPDNAEAYRRLVRQTDHLYG